MLKKQAVDTSRNQTTAQSLGALLKSAWDIMRKDKGLNGDLDRLPRFCSTGVLGGGFGRRLVASPTAPPRLLRTHWARTPCSPAGGTPALRPFMHTRWPGRARGG